MSRYSALILLLVLSINGCKADLDIPLEYPTPPPPVSATPVPPLQLVSDPELEKILASIAADARGEVGAAAVILESGDAALLNSNERFPMLSVYKLPIAMAVLEKVRRGTSDLEEKIGVKKEDMVRPGVRSPLRDQKPDGGEFTIRELIRLSIAESDGTASDVLLRHAGDADEVQAFLTRIGIFDMKVQNSTMEVGADWQAQYRNYSSPAAAVELLRWLRLTASSESGGEDEPVFGYLLEVMSETNTGAARIKALLPKSAEVAHKTGTSGTQNGITAATNDVGLIRLPDGRTAAVAIFVSDSTADERTRESIIARSAEAIWKRWASTLDVQGSPGSAK